MASFQTVCNLGRKSKRLFSFFALYVRNYGTESRVKSWGFFVSLSMMPQLSVSEVPCILYEDEKVCTIVCGWSLRVTIPFIQIRSLYVSLFSSGIWPTTGPSFLLTLRPQCLEMAIRCILDTVRDFDTSSWFHIQ